MPALLDLVDSSPSALSVGLVFLVVLSSSFIYLFSRPSIPKNAPKLSTEQWPIIGAFRFFTERNTWFNRQTNHSKTGNFSFYIGDKPVVGISGDEGRRVFFDSKGMGFSDGYAALLAGAPPVRKNGNPFVAEELEKDDSFDVYFSRRIIAMLKGNQLAKGLPDLVKDVRSRLDDLARDPSLSTDPFDSIYRIVYQLTMRTVACHEIASDDKLREKTLHLYETVENAASAWGIMYPWMPLWSKFQRTYAGAQLYMIFKKIIDERKTAGRREDDALQFLIDQGDDITKIITFVLGALFAGQLNSGINAAWILIYLTSNDDMRNQVFAEVNAVADKHNTDKSLPLKERLMSLPIDAWESSFPIIDACLRETIRLQMPGTAFRKNISGHDIPLDKAGREVIPKDAYAAYLISDVHLDPNVYSDPSRWDPERYMAGRQEDKKTHHAAIMWGVSRHPCLGMRFAKLENNIITAFFLAYFDDLQLWGSKGRLSEVPPPDVNFHTARRPTVPLHLKYKLRQEKA